MFPLRGHIYNVSRHVLQTGTITQQQLERVDGLYDIIHLLLCK